MCNMMFIIWNVRVTKSKNGESICVGHTKSHNSRMHHCYRVYMAFPVHRRHSPRSAHFARSRFSLPHALTSRGNRYRRPAFSAMNQLAVPRQIPLNKLVNGLRCTYRELSLPTSWWIIRGKLRVDLCESVRQLARGKRLPTV